MAWPVCANCCTEALGAVTGGGTGPTAASAPDRMEQDSAHTAGHCRAVGGHCGRGPERSNRGAARRPLLASCCEDTVWCSAIFWLGGRRGPAGAALWGSITAWKANGP